MSDEEKIPAEWPPEPTMEMITESFSKRDTRNTPSSRIETGDKKN